MAVGVPPSVDALARSLADGVTPEPLLVAIARAHFREPHELTEEQSYAAMNAAASTDHEWRVAAGQTEP